ncbi:MAG: tRNA (adenosine(37)-N6)-threonylcarbamoyltransferase complex dimerization subunit type 1 TsaB [Actinobacteria bacterium]|nr:tRNA (adenosine(37)-N6)-threonylcarbamoyltransferase complex dimerization subunit type 1 TsaB [Actinomycetota bacterium]
MPTLAIDTSTEVLALALGDGEKVLDELSIDAGRSHLEMLLPAVQDLLDSNGLAIGDLNAIVAGTGPGTFSGLRVGIATARALAQSLELPLFGYSSLEALANGLADGAEKPMPRWILPLIDARRGQVFARLYKKEGEKGLKPESEVLCLDPDRLSDILPEISEGSVRAGGNGALAFRETLAAGGRLELLETDDEANRMRAGWHISAAEDSEIAAGYHPGKLLSVLPFYVREPDADKTVLLKKREPWLK